MFINLLLSINSVIVFFSVLTVAICLHRNLKPSESLILASFSISGILYYMFFLLNILVYLCYCLLHLLCLSIFSNAYIYLFWNSELEIRHGREILHPLILFPESSDSCNCQRWAGLQQEVWEHISCGWQGPGTWFILCCFSQPISSLPD